MSRRIMISVTLPQWEAIEEALTARLAGPIDSDIRSEIYDRALDAVINAGVAAVLPKRKGGQ